MNEQLTLEYIFFHQEPCQKFKQFLQDKGVVVVQESVDQTDVEGLTVFIADNLDDELTEEIEAFYDDMMLLNEQLIVEQEDNSDMNNVGLAVSLSDGRSVLASVDPDILNRILSVISHQELGEVVDSVANAVEHPDDRPLCKRN